MVVGLWSQFHVRSFYFNPFKHRWMQWSPLPSSSSSSTTSSPSSLPFHQMVHCKSAKKNSLCVAVSLLRVRLMGRAVRRTKAVRVQFIWYANRATVVLRTMMMARRMIKLDVRRSLAFWWLFFVSLSKTPPYLCCANKWPDPIKPWWWIRITLYTLMTLSLVLDLLDGDE